MRRPRGGAVALAAAFATALAALAAPWRAAADVTTAGFDTYRSSYRPGQTLLHPALLSAGAGPAGSTFGPLWSAPVEGQARDWRPHFDRARAHTVAARQS